MEVSDLAVIGRLGRREPDGFYHIQYNPSFRSIHGKYQECFLIFSSDRVFFVTVDGYKSLGRREYLHFKEDGIDTETTKHLNVRVAMVEEDLNGLEEEKDDIESIYGFNAWFAGERIGTVSYAMINPMQSILVIELANGKELLVPHVEYFIQDIDINNDIVILQNIEGLLDLCE